MCGIVGIVGKQEPAWIRRMAACIRHRGPDDEGLFEDTASGVSLSMRRLSIIDLAGGHQPMTTEEKSVWIVFNGEIFNAPELRKALEGRGVTFVSQNSDTEVVLRLYLEKGERCLDDLNGMFAFVIYDMRLRRLFGARDRMGIKPLYWWSEKGCFAFASELKALLQIPLVKRTVNIQSLYHYVTLLYIPDSDSIFAGIRRLAPGHCFTYDLGNREFKERPYWRLTFAETAGLTATEWAVRIRGQLRSAVKRWTLSDVPIACSLSGGLDSSAMVGLLAEIGYPNIQTYSLGFAGVDEQQWDETALARQVANRYGTKHQQLVLRSEDLLKDLVAMVWHLDEPYGGGLPSWYVFRDMSRDVKVCLTGTGGDELFGNYGKYIAYERRMIVRVALGMRRMLGEARDMPARTCEYLARRFGFAGDLGRRLARVLRHPFGNYYYANTQYFSDEAKRAFVFNEHGGALTGTADYLETLYEQAGDVHLRNALMAVDFRTQLAEEFLSMTDRFSMAHSLEARVPYLDHELVETVLSVPARIRTQHSDPKYLFKLAVGDLLPADLMKARKRGFVIPAGLWLRESLRPLVERLLHPDRLRAQGIFRPEFYHTFVSPHLENREDHTWRVWQLLMFQLWHFIYIEQSLTEKPSFDWKSVCAS